MSDLTRYAIVDLAEGIVVNLTMLDPVSLEPSQVEHPPEREGGEPVLVEIPAWSPGEGYLLVAHETASVGWAFEAGVLTPPAPAGVDLEALKQSLKAEIDEAAERERLKYITPGAGQAMEYQQAAAEANALLAAFDADPAHVPDPANFPMLAASIGIDGDTLVEVAGAVSTMHQQWQAVGSAIRAARLSAKKLIDDAPDETSARAVQPVWPVFS